MVVIEKQEWIIQKYHESMGKWMICGACKRLTRTEMKKVLQEIIEDGDFRGHNLVTTQKYGDSHCE